MPDDQRKKGAEIIPFPRSKILQDGSLSSKVALLRNAGIKEKLEIILSDPEGKLLVRALEPQELYWMITELGKADALQLIAFSSPEQCTFFLDMEIWDGWTYSREKALEGLSSLMDAGEQRVVEQLPFMDYELLLLLCIKEFFVGGGIGDMLSDEERTIDWDHSYDNLFYITFRDEKNGPLMGRFMDIIFRNEHSLYLRLMEGARNEIESELEELCYFFRSGRLADLGFPERDQALTLYHPLDPEAYVADFEKDPRLVTLNAVFPMPFSTEDSLFQRALIRAESETLPGELLSLMNTALVAEDSLFPDADTMKSVLQRVYGYLTIALEFLTDENEDKAVSILQSEYLKKLFQIGYGIVSQLRIRAERISSDGADHAINRALLGFRRKCPGFYRGLDPDHVDGYREFREIKDVRLVDAFLSELER